MRYWIAGYVTGAAAALAGVAAAALTVEHFPWVVMIGPILASSGITIFVVMYEAKASP